MVSWSLVKSPLPLADPRQARYLKFALLDPGRLARLCRIRASIAPAPRPTWSGEIDAPAPPRRTAPAQRRCCPLGTVQSRDPMIRKLARIDRRAAAVFRRQGPGGARLARWQHPQEAVDTFSALDVLDAYARMPGSRLFSTRR